MKAGVLPWQLVGSERPIANPLIIIYLLLTKVSGTPILDKRALEKWGDDPEYQKYRDNTPALIPRFNKKS